MNMLKKTILFTALSTVTAFSHAAIVDFEDLVLGASYNVPDTFTTGGYTVNATDFQWSNSVWFSGGVASVENNGLAGGSGFDIEVNNINLEFQLPNPVSELSLKFGEYGGNLNLELSGCFLNFEDFVDINGSTHCGVSVAVTNGLGNDRGTLTLSGNISSFSIGGQELWIDDVAPVPLPAAAWLFISGILGIAGFVRCKRH